MKRALHLVGIFIMCSMLAGIIACSGSNSGGSSATDENRSGVADIKADSGGTVKFNNEMTISVPANSLSSDRTITIEHQKDVPQAFEDGYQPIGQAYSCKPGGTEFELSKPAVMELYYNEAALLEKGLDPHTLILFFYDEESSTYIAAESRVDLNNKKIIAHIEHFTIYLPLAKALLATNNPPAIARLASIPGTIRAGAPIYVRATIRDNDLEGAIVSPRVYFRRRNPTIDTWQSIPMTRDLRPTGTATEFNTYIAMIPTSYFNASNMGAGNDLQYYFQAYDNLGAVTTSATYSYNVTRTLNAGSLTITPSSLTVAAGFSTLFTVRGVDNNSTTFTLLPDTFTVSNALGTLKNFSSSGVCFYAQTKGTGDLTVTAGAEIITAPITVQNSELTSLQILDTNGIPLSGTLTLNYNSIYDFDVLGYDEFGNTALINPIWSCDALIGTMDQNGRLTTDLAYGIGNVTVTLGDLSDTQEVTVLEATKDILTFSLNGWTGTISMPFINVPVSDTQDITNLVATFTTNGTEVRVGGVVQQSGITANDFTNPVVYTVFASDGTSRDYTVSITVLSSAKAITMFFIDGRPGTIAGTNITVGLPYGTNMASLIATFTTTGASVSVGGVVQQNGVTANSFASPVTYTVTAQDGSATDYGVTTSEAGAVFYNANGADSGTVPFDPNVYLNGQNVTTMGNVGSLIKNNYDFYGWNTISDGSGITYLPGDVFQMEAVNITLYAIWGGWVQDAYLKASNAEGEDNFGYSVAISNNTIVVGAPYESSNQTYITNIDGFASADNSAIESGAVYVFKKDAYGDWNQDAYLKASNAESVDNFGGSVAISNDTIVVGAENESSNQTYITNTDGLASANNSAISSGAAYVFKKDALGNWNQDAYLKASNAESDDRFVVVAIYNDTIVVTAYYEDSNQTYITNTDGVASANNSATHSGAAYVFKRDALGNWIQDAYLKASNALEGDFAFAGVAISNDTIVLGKVADSSNQTFITNTDGVASTNGFADMSGAAFVFKKDASGNWIQDAYLKASNAESWDRFGGSVAISNDTIVVGAPYESSNQTYITNIDGFASADNSAIESGAAYVFKKDTFGDWIQDAYLKAANADSGDYFGGSVAISNDTIVVGAHHESSNQTYITNTDGVSSANNFAIRSGAAYVFKKDTFGDWIQDAYLKASNSEYNDFFACAVAISNKCIIVGAYWESSNQTYITNIDGFASANNSAIRSGAAYVFKIK